MFGCKPISASRSASLQMHSPIPASLSHPMLSSLFRAARATRRKRDGYTRGIQLRIFRGKGDSAAAVENTTSAFSVAQQGHPLAPSSPRAPVKTAEYSCLDIVKPHFRHYHYVKHVVEADKSNNGRARERDGLPTFPRFVSNSDFHSLSLPLSLSVLDGRQSEFD